jgi:hypothetical protein
MEKLLVSIITLVYMMGSVSWAGGLDGTASVIVETSQYSFSDGDVASGFVYLGQGCKIPAGASVSVNLLAPLAGALDLGVTGTMNLEGDLTLASNAQIVQGGNIQGNGNTLFLNGNLTLGAGKTITCVNNLVIDGQGHELFFSPGSPGGKLLINGAANTIVTLRNITLRGVMNYSALQRSIMFGTAANQKIVFENVKLFLENDFTFTGGMLDIKGLCAVYGWNSFNYQASYDLTILTDSTLFVDMRATFYYSPADSSRIHLAMIDQTSRLFLNGGTLSIDPNIGLRLISGHLIVDHLSVVNGNGATSESSGLILGSGINTQDLQIDILPGANLDLQEAFLVYNNQA